MYKTLDKNALLSFPNVHWIHFINISDPKHIIPGLNGANASSLKNPKLTLQSPDDWRIMFPMRFYTVIFSLYQFLKS